MKYYDFYSDVMRSVASRPYNWRYGQAVFNHIEKTYGVGYAVKDERSIDCFYDDSRVDAFIRAAWEILYPDEAAEPIKEYAVGDVIYMNSRQLYLLSIDGGHARARVIEGQNRGIVIDIDLP